MLIKWIEKSHRLRPKKTITLHLGLNMIGLIFTITALESKSKGLQNLILIFILYFYHIFLAEFCSQIPVKITLDCKIK